MKIFVLALAILAITASASSSKLQHRTNVLMHEGYTVDNVVNLLIAIARTTGDNLQQVIDNWSVAEAQLIDNIGYLSDLLSAQSQRCSELDITVTTLLSEIAKYKKNIHSAQKSIRTNLETIADRRDKRCQANLIFVQKLKDNQDGSKLLGFLRDRIADPSFKNYLVSNEGSLLEISAHMKSPKKSSSLSVIAKHHMLAMIQQYTGEDEELNYNLSSREEVGEGHHDNSKGSLALDAYEVDTRDLDKFVAELLGYINDLISELAHERHALQQAEFQSVEDLIDYQSSLDHQNIVLSTYIELWTVHIAELQVSLELNEADSSACHSRAEQLAQNLEDAESDYSEKEAAFKASRHSLESTLAKLEEVIRVYVSKVVNAPAVYLEKIDEELARAEPHEPEPVQPITEEEREEAVEQFEAEVRQEEARHEQQLNEEREAEREEAARERVYEAIQHDQEEREEERRHEAIEDAAPIVQEFTAQDLADEEFGLAQEAEEAVEKLAELASEDSEAGEIAYFTDDQGNEYFYGFGGESVEDFDFEEEEVSESTEVESEVESEEVSEVFEYSGESSDRWD